MEGGQEHIAIIVAGCPKSGKSKALNNLFHLDFDSSIAAITVTRNIKVKRVVKNGLNLIIVDTPGLGAADLNMDQVKTEIEKAIGGLSFTVLYCHSVGPNSKDEDQVVLKNLQKTLGKKVWEKCVFLFTFSDQLRNEHYPTNAQRGEYIRILRSHAQKLSSILQHHCGRDALNVRLVMDVGEDENMALNEIVAVPVGAEFKNEKEKHKLIPRRERVDDWRDCAFLEILRKSTPLEQYQLLSMMHGKAAVSTAVAGGTLGALLGGVGGALVGLIAGGIGAIPGAVVGMVVGSVGVGMGGAAMSRTVIQNHRETQRAKMERLKEAEMVENEMAVNRELPPEDFERPIQSPPIAIPNYPQQQQHVGETPLTMPTPQLATAMPVARSYDPKEEPDTEFT